MQLQRIGWLLLRNVFPGDVFADTNWNYILPIFREAGDVRKVKVRVFSDLVLCVRRGAMSGPNRFFAEFRISGLLPPSWVSQSATKRFHSARSSGATTTNY